MTIEILSLFVGIPIGIILWRIAFNGIKININGAGK